MNTESFPWNIFQVPPKSTIHWKIHQVPPHHKGPPKLSFYFQPPNLIGGVQNCNFFHILLVPNFFWSEFCADHENAIHYYQKSKFSWFFAKVGCLFQNLKKFWTYSKCIEKYTNRRRILRWFQKCITSYHYFEYFVTFGSLKIKFVTFRPAAPNCTFKMP